MLSHAEVWDAIDRLAKKYGMSASGLARRAGLDPTTFNKSKRIMPNGRQRWPSTESVSKVLKATGAPLEEFVAVAVGRGRGLVPAAHPADRSRPGRRRGLFRRCRFPDRRRLGRGGFSRSRRPERLRPGDFRRQHGAGIPRRRPHRRFARRQREARGPPSLPERSGAK